MIKIEDTIIAAVRDNSSNDFLSKLHLLSVSIELVKGLGFASTSFSFHML